MEPIPAAEARRHLRRLAGAIEGDPASCDAGRVLRLPGSRSRKTGRVARTLSITDDRYTLHEVVGDLPEMQSRPAWGRVTDRPARPVPVGRRHDELVRLLGWIRRQGYGDAEVLLAFARTSARSRSRSTSSAVRLTSPTPNGPRAASRGFIRPAPAPPIPTREPDYRR